MRRTRLGFICGAALALVASVTASAATNLPVVCSDSSFSGKPVQTPWCAGQTFKPPTSQSLVRVCGDTACSLAAETWQPFANLAATTKVEVCGADKAVGDPIDGGECQGTTAAKWGAMTNVLAQKIAPGGTAFPASWSFTVTPTHGVAPLSVTVAWNIPTAECANLKAYGAWTGTKANSGSEVISGVTANASVYLACTKTTVTGNSAQLDWTPPTTNTDGTPLTDLSAFNIVWGATCTTKTSTASTAPNVLTYTVQNLSPGSYCFAVKAMNAAGKESLESNNAVKVIGTKTVQDYAAGRDITIDKVPGPPVLTVTETTAYRLKQTTNNLAAVRVGTVPAGTACDSTQDALKLNRVPREAVALDSGITTRPSVALAKCAAPQALALEIQ